jgi:hypothetical protein
MSSLEQQQEKPVRGVFIIDLVWFDHNWQGPLE